MANKTISELTEATVVNEQDLFVLEQSGLAKKMTAETFITAQNLVSALATALSGHGGISSVTLSSVSGRIRTYLITFTDATTTTFQVYDGTSIDRIAKTSEAGLVSTYTIYMNDGTTSFFQVRNGQDGSATWDQINSKAPIIPVTTASSAIVTFADGADNIPMQSVLVDIEPVQDLSNGDPSPTNICPITGSTEVNTYRTGINVWDEEWEAGGIDPSNGQNRSYSSPDSRMRSANYIPIKPSTTYYMTLVSKVICYYKEDKTFISGSWNTSLTFTTPSNAYYLRFSTNDVYGATYQNNISINYPSSDTSYHAYAGGTSLTASWQTEAGTVYGGTIDVATGLLTVNRKIITVDGSQSVSASQSNRFYYSIPEAKTINASNQTTDASVICDKARPVTWDGLGTDSIVGTDFCCAPVYGNGIGFRWDSITTAADWETYFTNNPTQFSYELATPRTYQLSEQDLNTLFGNNTVWSDLGDVTVTYPADTKTYIDNAIAALA